MSVYSYIEQSVREGKKRFACLVDPQKIEQDLVSLDAYTGMDSGFIFVGGSSGGDETDAVVSSLKSRCQAPVVLFPGNVGQVSKHADALLFLSLLSGRNPEMLIGQQVRAAQQVRASHLETIPMGYILVDGGCDTAVARVSQTSPLAQSDVQTIVSTALAAEMLGMRCVYLEAGSGALCPVSVPIIRAVRKAISIPLIVGGGICSTQAMERAFNAGADIVVVGNYLESHPEALPDFIACAHALSRTDSLSQQKEDERFMRMALVEAQKAYDCDEVPVGCVIVSQGQVLGRGHNLTQTLADVTAHAEMQALTAAAQTMGGKYLTDATLYVTVEPCVMCAGAIGWAQIGRVVYGCADDRRGFEHLAPSALHAKCSVRRGVLEADCAALMQSFFSKKRKPTS